MAVGVTRPLVIAHRGASGLAPENTLAAFALALEMKAEAIELDVHRTRDGEIVVIHDADVNRTAGASGSIDQLTLAELKLLDAGSWFNRAHPQQAKPEYAGQQIPTLVEVLELVRGRARLFIEIKDPGRYPAGFVAELVALVRGAEMLSKVTFLSFNRPVLKRLHSLGTAIPFGLNVDRPILDPVKSATALHAASLGLRHQWVTANIVKRAHASGLAVNAWTVNEPADVSRVLAAGVDGIISDHPGRLLLLTSGS
jgi:glycerophosphoryl diester phosphodiesterase